MTMTWRARDSRGHYLASRDVHTTLGPEDWDDTCRHQPSAELQPSKDDFGHEPMDVITNGRRRAGVCARCRQRDIYGYSREASVRWPCTSAIVLGLAPQAEAAA